MRLSDKDLEEKAHMEQDRETEPAEERSLNTIAWEIRSKWKKVHYAAFPYLLAMIELDKITDMYMHDTGVGIVLRFLGNASSWRGEDAKRIKAELKAMLKGK